MGRFSITLGEYEIDILSKYIESRNGIKENTGVNELVKCGLLKYQNHGKDDAIRLIMREQINITLKPYTESLASLSSKVAHMSGRTIYLLVQFALDTLNIDGKSGELIKKLHSTAVSVASSNMMSKPNDKGEEGEE